MDLPAHMAECDANYLRLNKLFPEMADSDRAAIALELNGQRLTVRMEVMERSPYTTLIRLSQHPDAPWNHRARMTVRLYHDARSAEVVE